MCFVLKLIIKFKFRQVQRYKSVCVKCDSGTRAVDHIGNVKAKTFNAVRHFLYRDTNLFYFFVLFEMVAFVICT